jgi:hypothetical protein
VYEEIAGPPVDAGATKETVADPFPTVAVTPVGASGLPAGVIAAEVAAAEVPVELVAVTLNVYAVPFVNGETEQEVAGAVIVQLPPVGEDVTVYEAGSPPPLPAATVTVAPPSDPETDEIVGVTGIAIFHCAINVLFALPIVVAEPATRFVVPLLHPSNVNPERENPVAASKLIAAPLAATVAAGVFPAVEPFVL